MMIIIILGIFFSIQHYFMPRDKENTVTESKFRLRKSFMEERFDVPTKELIRYLEEQEEKSSFD